jgi:hypothetical protein
MNSLNFLDTNVWLALVWERHANAGQARHVAAAIASSLSSHRSAVPISGCAAKQMPAPTITVTKSRPIREYEEAVRDSRKKWRQAHPDYQTNYWLNHTDAAEQNRRRQRQRDASAACILLRAVPDTVLANSDTLAYCSLSHPL